MKKALAPMVFGVFLLVAQSADAVYVTIDASSGYYRNQSISQRGHMVGVAGDYFELNDGSHRLFIDAPRNHYVSMDIEVRLDNLEIKIDKGQSLGDDGCKEGLRTVWKGRLEARQSHFEHGVLWTIVLPEIEFGGPTGEGSCSFPSSISCERSAYNLSVDTRPVNAEIWLDDERVDYRTPTGQLRVSYCEFRESVHVLTRVPGYVNCAKEFDIYPDANVVFHCEMKQM